jgi:hypothetical protein
MANDEYDGKRAALERLTGEMGGLRRELEDFAARRGMTLSINDYGSPNLIMRTSWPRLVTVGVFAGWGWWSLGPNDAADYWVGLAVFVLRPDGTRFTKGFVPASGLSIEELSARLPALLDLCARMEDDWPTPTWSDADPDGASEGWRRTNPKAPPWPN